MVTEHGRSELRKPAPSAVPRQPRFTHVCMKTRSSAFTYIDSRDFGTACPSLLARLSWALPLGFALAFAWGFALGLPGAGLLGGFGSVCGGGWPDHGQATTGEQPLRVTAVCGVASSRRACGGAAVAVCGRALRGGRARGGLAVRAARGAVVALVGWPGVLCWPAPACWCDPVGWPVRGVQGKVTVDDLLSQVRSVVEDDASFREPLLPLRAQCSRFGTLSDSYRAVGPLAVLASTICVEHQRRAHGPHPGGVSRCPGAAGAEAQPRRRPGRR